ncbi:MAG: AMP-binding protein [Rhodobacter sp.]|nr:AMP-binding protein [Rhodobacter sp.]
MNFAGFLVNAARSWGDRPAVSVGQGLHLDYAGLGRAVAGLAGALRHRFGLRPGDRVLLAMSNNPDYLTILFACWQAGLVAVPANAKLHPREIGCIGQDSGARVVFATADLAQGVAAELPGLPLILPGRAEFAALVAQDGLALHESEPTDTAWIFYTSGTTGRPKGALLSHRNLAAMAIAYLADVDHLTPRDALLHLAATSHASGLFGLSFVARAGNNILPEAGGYDPAEMAAIIGAQESLTFFAPTALLERMAQDGPMQEAPRGHIRTILTGAGPVRAADIRRTLAAFGLRLWNGYGQGESPCTITAMSREMIAAAAAAGDDAALTSVGIARSGITLRIARPDGTEAAPDEMGEVLVRGDTVMAGYLNQPAATAEALAGGWLHTGDLGRLDGRGFLHLSDRKKDLIITGGMNVYAREVEEVLLTHPGVAEVAVIGAPDARWGESVLALVVPRAGAIPAPGEMDGLCLNRLARFKRPKRYEMVASLPRNPAGKVLKAVLRDQWRHAFDGGESA